MALPTWGEYKTIIRRTILKKDPTGVVWSDEMLLDGLGWALDGLCVHTALQKTVTYNGDSTTQQFALPDDVYVPLDEAGLVMVFDTSSQVLNYLKPAYSSFDIAATEGNAFSVWPEDTLETGVPIPTGVNLVVRYYAYYPHPTQDSDVLTIPQWALAAVAYSTCIHALTSRSLIEADNATSKTKPDSGQPENNSMRQLQQWWIKMYDRELSQYPKQRRIASFR